MREFSVPSVATISSVMNLTEPVWDNAETHPNAVQFARHGADGAWHDVTCAETAYVSGLRVPKLKNAGRFFVASVSTATAGSRNTEKALRRAHLALSTCPTAAT